MGGVMKTKHQVRYEEGKIDINTKEKLKISLYNDSQTYLENNLNIA